MAIPAPVTLEQRREWQSKVSDPLERLRGTIRLYVSLEGAAVVLLYLALWFWIGLLVDYGCFTLFTLDWVQVLPWGLRAGLLVILVAGLLALLVAKVTLRLVREFRASALALVLERRFPRLLGDRLITAVEMADPHKAAQCGYSQAMIDRTIQEAAERVGQVPVSEAFNWQRLRRLLRLVGLLTVGVFALCAIGHGTMRAIDQARAPERSSNSSGFLSDFGHVAGLWFERNILLQDTLWPRRVHLELVGFPQDGELRVGTNAGSAPIRVRAFKWVLADKESSEGWRQLLWSDLDERWLGIPAPPLPAQFFPSGQDWSVDHVDLVTERATSRQEMPPDVHARLRDVIDRLQSAASQPGLRRTLRQLEIPDEVILSYQGANTEGEQPLQREDQSNDFVGVVSGLKETVRFRVCAVNYCTRPRLIALVPPPVLRDLWREEAQPAYLHQRPPRDGTAADLKGLKQRFSRERVPLRDDTAQIHLPTGTDLKLIGSTGRDEKDKDLQKVAIVPRGLAEFQKGLPEALKDLPPTEAWLQAHHVGAVRLLDDRTFELQIERISNRLDFDLELTDTDNIVARRRVVIQPAEDTAPEVEVAPAIVRKTADGWYMVTASAKIPFDGRARDDHGLERLAYEYSYVPFDEEIDQPVRAALVVRLLHATPAAMAGNPLLAGPQAGSTLKVLNKAMKERTDAVPLSTFATALQEKMRSAVSREALLQRLQNKPSPEALLRVHDIVPVTDPDTEPEKEGLDLQRHLPQLKTLGPLQLRFRLRVKLSATDNNVETGPRTSDSRETFGFVIVSENELLGAIAHQQTGLHEKLKSEVVARLDKIRIRLGQIDGSVKDKELGAAQAELALQLAEATSTCGSTTRAIYQECVGILNELKVNRIGRDRNSVNRVLALLRPVVDERFPVAEQTQRELQQALARADKDPEAARQIPERLQQAQRGMDELLQQLDEVLHAFDGLRSFKESIKLAQELLAGQLDVLRKLVILKKIKDLEAYGDPGELIVGKWQAPGDSKETVEFFKDGKALLGGKQDARYRFLDEDTLELELKMPGADKPESKRLKVAVDDEVLTLDDSGKKLRYLRVK
jgi:hypothetical protein